MAESELQADDLSKVPVFLVREMPIPEKEYLQTASPFTIVIRNAKWRAGIHFTSTTSANTCYLCIIVIRLPKQTRQKALSLKWEFICKCERCEAGDTPDELEGLRKWYEIDKYMDTLCSEEKGAVMFDKLLEVLPIREKIQGPFHPDLTEDMWFAAKNRFFSGKILTDDDKKNLLMLMEKVMKAWPITHGTDHWVYKEIVELNEKVNRKFGKKEKSSKKSR
jgi:hypothetical protein